MTDKTKYDDVIKQVAQDAGSTPEKIQELRKHMGIELREALEKEGSVHLAGFGTFYLKWSDARQGINPQTGDKIEIKAHNHVSFRPDASVRRTINKEYEHLKAFILDENDEKAKAKTKTPVWIFVLLGILLLALIASLLNPRAVIVTEEIVVVEEVLVPTEVVVVEEVIITEEVEVIVVKEVVVTNEVSAPAVQKAIEAPDQANSSDIVEDISAMPTADAIDHSTQAPIDVSGIDPDIAAAEAGMASAIAEEAVFDAEIATAKAKISEAEAKEGVRTMSEVQAAEKKADTAEAEALADLSAEIKANEIADAAAAAAEAQEKK